MEEEDAHRFDGRNIVLHNLLATYTHDLNSLLLLLIQQRSGSVNVRKLQTRSPAVTAGRVVDHCVQPLLALAFHHYAVKVSLHVTDGAGQLLRGNVREQTW
jgi:hypothetical protein